MVGGDCTAQPLRLIGAATPKGDDKDSERCMRAGEVCALLLLQGEERPSISEK